MAFQDSLMLPLRGVQVLFLIITLGLTGYVVNVTNGFYGEFNYLLFACIWTILALAYLIAAQFVAAIAQKIAMIVVEALTMIFWFTAWIASAALVGKFDNIDYGDDTPLHSAQAATAFGAFMWLLFVATLVFTILGARGGGAHAGKGPTPYGQA